MAIEEEGRLLPLSSAEGRQVHSILIFFMHYFLSLLICHCFTFRVFWFGVFSGDHAWTSEWVVPVIMLGQVNVLLKSFHKEPVLSFIVKEVAYYVPKYKVMAVLLTVINSIEDV
ncbi:hypothetical protein I3843_16G062000 [Carya illinoinensis]|uniref:Uncharacterized protein n=1 Tax=Carya illinoinensis TaxID=32201 RepID=A0A922A5Q5_CARIL|nr:hypothetical protein I3842_16G059600 [Carya illinoinensis]KAG7941755.1 hypothetical protein I3843_16G062000 [Carya illinoinensis]